MGGSATGPGGRVPCSGVEFTDRRPIRPLPPHRPALESLLVSPGVVCRRSSRSEPSGCSGEEPRRRFHRRVPPWCRRSSMAWGVGTGWVSAVPARCCGTQPDVSCAAAASGRTSAGPGRFSPPDVTPDVTRTGDNGQQVPEDSTCVGSPGRNIHQCSDSAGASDERHFR